MTEITGRITKFGFHYGPAKVTRSWSHKGHVGLEVHTGKQTLDIRITPTGLIRVGEIKPDWRKPGDDDE
jgi:hypothetical protein